MGFFGALERRLSWELTKVCGRGCAHCVSALYHDRLPTELDTARALGVLDRCKEGRVGRVHFFGGEPTARADLPVLLERCGELGIDASLTTNGSLVDDRLIETFAAAGSPLRAVTVSFEDIRPRAQDAIRGQGAYEAACRAIRGLRAGAPAVAVRVAFTVTRPAMEELPPAPILEHFGELGVERVGFQDLAVPPDPPPGLARLAYDGPLWLGFLEKLYGVDEVDRAVPFSYGLKPLVIEEINARTGRSLPVGPYTCRAGARDLRLLPNGTLLPCSAAVGWPAMLDGYVAEAPTLPEASIAEVLATPLHARFATSRDTRHGDPAMEPCSRCHLAWERCNPCVFGRLAGEDHRVESCAWVMEARDATGAVGSQLYRVPRGPTE